MSDQSIIDLGLWDELFQLEAEQIQALLERKRAYINKLHREGKGESNAFQYQRKEYLLLTGFFSLTMQLWEHRHHLEQDLVQGRYEYSKMYKQAYTWEKAYKSAEESSTLYLDMLTKHVQGEKTIPSLNQKAA